MLAKGLRFVLDPAQCDDPGASDAALAEADTDARLLRAMSAACRHRGAPGRAAAAGEAARSAGYLSECMATSATTRTVAGTSGTADEIQVDIDGEGR